MAPRGGSTPSTELNAYTIPNMVQGVSQQTAQQRRDSQCEAQFNCINSPLNGCEARPGFDYLGKITGANLSTAFCYEIFRGDTEHYLVVIAAVAYGTGPRKLHVYDLNTGLECAVTFTASEAYLVPTEAPNVAYKATTVEDTTFIGQRNIAMLMDASNKSPAAVNQAVIFVRAGGYIINYQVAVTYNGHVYTWAYTTPDNSTVANAPYIATSAIAAAFFHAFTGSAATPTPTGTAIGSLATGSVAGVGPNEPSSNPTAGGATTLTSLGFTVKINGNCLLISRADDAAFKVDTADGVGDTFLRAVKDTAQAFDDLPGGCFVGFTTKVIGSNRETADDYYVQFTGQDGTLGTWQEVVAPGVPLSFNAGTMPHSLVNTGVGTFEWKRSVWGSRVSGDGVTSSPDPSFVGKTLRDISFDHGRLLIMVEGSAVWSRAKNVSVFFPDTAQTVLGTDPIDIVPGGGKTIALLRAFIQVAETAFLWAEKIQFRITSGINKFTQDAVEAPPSTSYEFAPLATPKAVGESLYFATEPGPYATIRDLGFTSDGKPSGAINITGHIARYIKSGIRWITASDTLGILLATSIGAPNSLFAYNYLFGDNNSRVQSAWNTWSLPEDSAALWAAVSLNHLFALVQRGSSEALLLRMDMSVDRVDADAGATYLTRMDCMVTEAQCTVFAYDADEDTTTITLPYTPSEADGYDGTTPDTCPMFVASRVSSVVAPRGKNWPIKSITASTKQIVVVGDCHAEALFLGYRITASRKESAFYLKSDKGLVPTDRLQVHNYKVNFGAGTGYFRADVVYIEGQPSQTYYMTGRIFGDPNNMLGVNPITEGSLKVPVDCENTKASITLVNDSFLPSRWVSASYDYTATIRARPSAYGQGK